jgi:hypothetical protein
MAIHCSDNSSDGVFGFPLLCTNPTNASADIEKHLGRIEMRSLNLVKSFGEGRL